MLPDSNVNVAASNGFVKFKVAQKPNLDLETKFIMPRLSTLILTLQ